MSYSLDSEGFVWVVQLSLPGTGAGACVPSSAFWGSSLKKVNSAFTLPKVPLILGIRYRVYDDEVRKWIAGIGVRTSEGG
ncbi:hypothetical protein Syun_000490 [Stephania yunnanensis]|uniref:Uncharacterized protein n=1 Tax=Stephania yunnanensis TaxID=152371 RepID=A0AAP0LD52_9MAGN